MAKTDLQPKPDLTDERLDAALNEWFHPDARQPVWPQEYRDSMRRAIYVALGLLESDGKNELKKPKAK